MEDTYVVLGFAYGKGDGADRKSKAVFDVVSGSPALDSLSVFRTYETTSKGWCLLVVVPTQKRDPAEVYDRIAGIRRGDPFDVDEHTAKLVIRRRLSTSVAAAMENPGVHVEQRGHYPRGARVRPDGSIEEV